MGVKHESISFMFLQFSKMHPRGAKLSDREIITWLSKYSRNICKCLEAKHEKL